MPSNKVSNHWTARIGRFLLGLLTLLLAASWAVPVVWALVLIFVLGPCEALLPLLVVPVARGDTGGAVLVAGIFGATTLLAMVGAVWVGLTGAAWVRAPWLGRWGHSLAGAAVMGCGVAVLLGL